MKSSPDTRFAGFLGNPAAKETLARFISSGRLPHALLLTGPAGIGKRTLAKLAAMAMLCRTNPGERPCGECPSCKKALSHNHPDLHWINAEGGRTFKIGAVRDMRAALAVAPSDGELAVWVLRDAHTLTTQAASALLKVLEEPPRHVRFILTAHSRESLLSTLLSRVTVIPLEPVTTEQCRQELTSRIPDADPALLSAAALGSGGCIGAALSAMEDQGFSLWLSSCRAIAESIASGDEYALLTALTPYERDREGLDRTLSRLSLIVRDTLAVSAGSGTCLSGERTLAASLAGRIGPGGCSRLLSVLGDAAAKNAANVSGPLLICWLSASLRRAVRL